MVEITADLLLRAYAAGLFPMAESADATDLFWLDPDPRGILPLDEFHIAKRLRRTIGAVPYEIRCDTDFIGVMQGCAEATETRPQTWINPAILSLFGELHRRGYAHSIEAWQDGRLIGGLYGVALAGAFFGESMFSRARDASKIALVHLAARLVKGGFALLDTQFVTDHLKQFGAMEIPRLDYHGRLENALKVAAYFPVELADDPLAVLQSSSVRS